jgi:hypothetical protein
MHCHFCSEYIGLLSIYGSLCDYCSGLRRLILLYKKPLINQILMKHLNGINLLEKPDPNIVIKLGDDENTMLKHQLERLNDD